MRLAKAIAVCAAVTARTALFGASLLASSEAAAADELAVGMASAAGRPGSPISVSWAQVGERLSVNPRGVMVDVVLVGHRF